MSDVVIKPNTKALPTKPNRIKYIRDSHHMMARLFALGHTRDEVANMTGYTRERVGQIRSDQAFSELVAHYSKTVDEAMAQSADEYFSLAEMARIKSMRMIVDKLDDVGDNLEGISIRELVTVHADAADRTGYGKRSTQVNVNVDFASRLDQAIARSNKAKVIDQPAAPPSLVDAVDAGGTSGEGPPAVIPNLRRAG